jgi:hypothetical protein
VTIGVTGEAEQLISLSKQYLINDIPQLPPSPFGLSLYSRSP